MKMMGVRVWRWLGDKTKTKSQSDLLKSFIISAETEAREETIITVKIKTK